MKKRILKSIQVCFYILITSLLITACKKEDVVKIDDVDKGPYVSRADSAKIFSGRNRLLITWINKDPKVTTAKVYWKKDTSALKKDSLIYQISPGSENVDIYINDLEEGNYELEVFTYDNASNNSGKVLLTGHVFGSAYAGSGDSVKLNNITYSNQSLILDWIPVDNAAALGTQVVYTDKAGVEKTLFVDKITTQTDIADITNDLRGYIKYRTVYAPGTNIIDTLFSGYSTVPFVNRLAVFDSLPGWKFRCKVMAEATTIEDHGGMILFKQKMDDAMVRASKKFQVKGLNDEGNNEIHFYATEIIPFTGASSQYTTKQWLRDSTLDIMLVVNDNAASGDDSWGWRRTPYLTLGHDYDGLFGSSAVDALVHEFGHTRGMYDLYLGEVIASRNPISNQAYESDRCIMNYPYGETVWSEFSKIIINASAGEKVAKFYWNYFPDVFKVNVRRKNNTVATGAQLKFYPVIQTSSGNVVRENDVILYRATIGSSGTYDFNSNNPFAINQVASNNMYNFLVEVIYKVNTTEYKEYAWMPMNDALVAGSKELPYELKITLSR